MESWHCLLLLGTLGLSLVSGEMAKNDDGINLVSLLKSIYPRLLVRDEPFIINQDLEVNSLKEPRLPEPLSVTEQTKDKPVRQDANEAPGPLVLTKDGQIKGVTADKAHIFYGIPYADPPVGAYRWKPPRSVTPWRGIYDASFPRAACMQVCSGPATEECPRMVRNNAFLPCLVFIIPGSKGSETLS